MTLNPSEIAIPSGVTTGIGSLPHHNIDAALAFAFQFDVPYLPQIPIRNPWEYVVAQALEGIPGIRIEADGSALVDFQVWEGRSGALDEKLLEAFASSARPDAFVAFEPSNATSSSWQPFLWELEEQGKSLAKIQTAGPLTCQWVLRSTVGEPTDSHQGVSAQIFRLVLARAIGMCRRLKAQGVQPMVFLDEPALYVYDAKNPRHVLGVQELKILIQAVKKEGARIGLHCCSDTDWGLLFGLGLDMVSLDAGLSLDSVLKARPALEGFLDGGGRLSLGIIPTSIGVSFSEQDARRTAEGLTRRLEQGLGADRAHRVLQESWYTPACGLALHTPNDAELILSSLKEVTEICVAM